LIFNERVNRAFREFWVLGELAVFPTGEPVSSTDPESAITRYQQGIDELAGKLLTGGPLPANGANPIEAIKTESRAQPEITVRGLRNGADVVLNKPVADFPRGVPILAEVERWIESRSAGPARQHHAGEDHGSCPRSCHLGYILFQFPTSDVCRPFGTRALFSLASRHCRAGLFLYRSFGTMPCHIGGTDSLGHTASTALTPGRWHWTSPGGTTHL